MLIFNSYMFEKIIISLTYTLALLVVSVGRGDRDHATNGITDKMTKINQTHCFFLNLILKFYNIVFIFSKLDYL